MAAVQPIEVNYEVGRTLYCFRSSLTAAEGTAEFYNTITGEYELYDVAHWTQYVVEIPEVAPGYYKTFPPDDSLQTPATERIFEERDTGVGPQVSDAPAIGQSNSQGAGTRNPTTDVGSNADAVVDIINLALTHLGQKLIETIDDPTENARRAKLIYNTIRDEVLRDASWKFATVIAELVENDDVDVSGFGFVFDAPTDLIFIRRVFAETGGIFDLFTDPSQNPIPQTNPLGIPYLFVYDVAEDTHVIACNINPAFIIYTVRLADPSFYDALFKKALSYKLAMELAMKLNGSPTESERMGKLYALAISEAAKVNGMEDGIPQRRKSTTIDAR